MDFQPKINDFGFAELVEMKYHNNIIENVTVETSDKYTLYTKGYLSIYVFEDGKVFISEENNNEWRLISNSDFKASNSTKNKTLVVSFD